MASAGGETATAGRVLDVVAAAFGALLRSHGVEASPAEVIEVRRVLGLFGVRNRARLRAGLRAVCVKYAHEGPGFDAAFAALFARSGAEDALSADDPGAPTARLTGGLPEDIELGEDGELGRYADYNERAADVGEHFDTDDAEDGFNPHKDDDDYSVTAAAEDVSVDLSADSGKRGVSYTLDLARAATTDVGALSDGASVAAEGALRWDDPGAILAWLDAYDPRRVYADGPAGEELTRSQVERLAAALAAFVSALAVAPRAAGEAPVAEQRSRHEVELAATEVLRRMRGAPRNRVRFGDRGRLDMRATMRASMRTDGVPFRLAARVPRRQRLRLLILADVSLSVRPITAFTLRLAQTVRRRVDRCEVYAFVDRPVRVTRALLSGEGDDVLARVLADPSIDLEASSDYGRVLGELLSTAPGIGSTTSVLIVGDGRSNGLPDGAEHLAELRRRVHRLAWVTPEPERYWNQATCAMPVYAEDCDGVVVARDAEQLIAVAHRLGDALR
ncbi:MadC family VWA domain-containing protein [Tsukamurella paurometabola]|uniref:VWA domain-containing protein n=1 Tax=Tsukamurella paurometabola TaxID=2061 RepID=A0ABS5NB35_TSUPA|nr:VWA domain-containing protein [Tsukamurella paurometabola]MBS4101097.1 VWA domain-containing protein [Tsukamurella paurometabola]